MTLHFFGAGQPTALPPVSVVGLKGLGLLQMSAWGLPVPAGVVIGVESCASGTVDDATLTQALEGLQGTARPLLLSVRSSGTQSMPGLMDTLLNVGVTSEMASSGTHVLADAYRRLLTGFGSVVFGMRAQTRGALDPLRIVVDRACDDEGVDAAGMLSLDRLRKLGLELKAALAAAGHAVPDDTLGQLRLATRAVLASAHGERMAAWRRDHGGSEIHTALIIQVMVLGNAGETSGTGVAISRHPTTGERKLYGEFLKNAQGEELLGGSRSPLPLGGGRAGQATLEVTIPAAFTTLQAHMGTLESRLRDVQEAEFTVDNGTLWLLQTRRARRSARAAVRIAVEMEQEKTWSRGEALLQVEPASLTQLLAPQVAAGARRDVAARGVPASVGVAVGRVVLHSEDARSWRARGIDTVLVRTETRADDFPGMEAAAGVVTSRGGTTSHAAVVCRGLGKCCVVGCPDIRVDYAQRLFTTKSGHTVREGDVITVDGHSGEILVGLVELDVQPALPQLAPLMAWADETRQLRVLADVENAADAALAVRFGADGPGRILSRGPAEALKATLDAAGGKAWIRIDGVEQAVAAASVVTGELALIVASVETGEAMRKAALEIRDALKDRAVLLAAEVATEQGARAVGAIAQHADALVVEAGLVENVALPAPPIPVGVYGPRAAERRVLEKVQGRVAWISLPLRLVPGARLAAAQLSVTTEKA